jgi:hypothetical protein
VQQNADIRTWPSNNSRTESGAKNKIHKVCPCEASCDKVRYHSNKLRVSHSNGEFLYIYATHVLFVITGILPFHLQELCGKKFPVCSQSVVSDKRCSVSVATRIAFQSGILPIEFVIDFLNATFCSDVVHGPKKGPGVFSSVCVLARTLLAIALPCVYAEPGCPVFRSSSGAMTHATA